MIQVTVTTPSGQSARVRPGQNVLVGRASWAELSVRDDAELSGRHFSLESDGLRCRLVDHKSGNGTLVNGRRVAEAVLQDGDTIQAGTTTFAVRVEGDAPAPAPAAEPPAATPAPPQPEDAADAGPSLRPGEFLILEIAEGEQAGRKLTLRPGQKGLLGRSMLADLSLAEDAKASQRHVQLVWEQGQCRLVDLQSTHGTFLNGSRVTEAPLRDGDRILAGGTVVAVRVAGETGPAMPAAAPARDESPPAGTPRDRVLQFLQGLQEPLYALLDAARDPAILPLLRASGDGHQSLYEGPQGEVLAEWAPYLVRFRAGSPLPQTLVREGWGRSWGVFLTSPQPFAEVRKHFRRFLMVRLPDGREAYFRYYDPRVLRVFLPTCTAAQAAEFFQAVTGFYAEADDPDTVLKFTARGGAVRKDVLALWLAEGPRAGSRERPVEV